VPLHQEQLPFCAMQASQVGALQQKFTGLDPGAPPHVEPTVTHWLPIPLLTGHQLHDVFERHVEQVLSKLQL